MLFQAELSKFEHDPEIATLLRTLKQKFIPLAA